MGTKLVKLDVPKALHARISANAAAKTQTIGPYLLKFLEEHIPRQITFPQPPSKTTVESKQDESGQEPIRRDTQADAGHPTAKDERDKGRKKAKRKKG